jgi:RNA polymerase sigma factor (sigma-70 family)
MKKLDPPTHLEPEYLYKKYEPLRKSVFNKFKDKMSNQADKEDLISTIDHIFLQLVSEYDPNRGVDFPYYIKRMLDLRTYHHITKYLKNANRESYSDENGLTIEDDSFNEIFKRIEDLNSIDPNIELGEKHRELMIGILIHRKSIKQLAEEEGVPPDRLHARLYFLRKKMQEVHKEHIEEYGEDLY